MKPLNLLIRRLLPLEEVPDSYKSRVAQICIDSYIKAMNLMEHSVGDVALAYVERNPAGAQPFRDKLREKESDKKNNKMGALLAFANVYAQRYMDLLEGYIDYEIHYKIPMISADAGQLKLHGFTSKDLIEMKPSTIEYITIIEIFEQMFKNNSFDYQQVISTMTGMNKAISCDDIINNGEKRNEFISLLYGQYSTPAIQNIVILFRKYALLPKKEMLNKVHFLCHDYGHMTYPQITERLEDLARGDVKYLPTRKERLIMEIRHRIAGDMSIQQNSLGTLGGNPLAYLKVLTEGEPGNPQAEFREKMYFVYMLNHFSNAVMREPIIVEHINSYLKSKSKGWAIDPEFVSALENRQKGYIPPIFRYAGNAALSREIRNISDYASIGKFYSEHPNIPIRQAMEGTTGKNDYYRLKLSERELFNQMGEWEWNSKDINRPWSPLNFGTGAAVFKLFSKPTDNMSDAAKAYVNEVNNLFIPVYSGISGTLDQSTAMAGLVGLGVDKNVNTRRLELETIKLAYLAFMLPGRDHSVHEIMQSSKSYGAAYTPGSGYQKYLYPPDKDYVEEKLKEYQITRQSNIPDYYLKEEYVMKALNQAKEEAVIVRSNNFRPLQIPSIQIQSPNSFHSTEDDLENNNVDLDLMSATTLDDESESSWDTLSGGYSRSSSVSLKPESDISYFLAFSVEKEAIEESVLLLSKNPHINHIPYANLHVTIGWINSAKPINVNDIAKDLKPMILKYQQIAFNIDRIELSDNGEDILMTLKDELPGALDKIRTDIKAYLKGQGIEFEWISHNHILMAHFDKAMSLGLKERQGIVGKLQEQAENKLKGKELDFKHINIMHYNPQIYKIQSDYQFSMGEANSKISAAVIYNKYNEKEIPEQPEMRDKTKIMKNEK